MRSWGFGFVLGGMNIVLFEVEETERPLPLADARAEHLRTVLRRGPGELFDAGLIDGPKGKGWIVGEGPEGLELGFRWGAEEPPLAPVDLIVGLSRPQTNRKVLQDVTTLGARSMRFVATERGEPSYAQSKLWTSGEWRRHLVDGAAQAFGTRLPLVRFGMRLEVAVAELPVGGARIALDNYEATAALPELLGGTGTVTLAVGSERGWSAGERERLRGAGFTLAELGPRALRTETAATLAVGRACARGGCG